MYGMCLCTVGVDLPPGPAEHFFFFFNRLNSKTLGTEVKLPGWGHDGCTDWNKSKIPNHQKCSINTCSIAAHGLHVPESAARSSCNAKARRPETSVRSGCVTSAAVWPGSHLKYVSTDLMFTLQSCLGRVGINIYIQYCRDDGEQVSSSPCDILDPSKVIQADQLLILLMSASNIHANRWECRFDQVVNIREVNVPFSIMSLCPTANTGKFKQTKS